MLVLLRRNLLMAMSYERTFKKRAFALLDQGPQQAHNIRSPLNETVNRVRCDPKDVWLARPSERAG